MKTRRSVPAWAAVSMVPCLWLLCAPAAHADDAEEWDEFGSAVARGDFNGDGFEDLAVGVPGEDIEGVPAVVGAGAVEVIYGTASGLGGANRQLWHQDVANVEDVAENNDKFGASLAAGDFNNDGFDDLAIGVDWEDLKNTKPVITNAGAVNALYGSSTGISATTIPDQLWTQPYIQKPPPLP